MSNSLIEREHKVIFQTYKRLPIVVSHALGCRIFDIEGKSYLDFLGGIAVNALGHSHPKILAAISEQAQKYLHVSNYFYQEPQILLAEILIELTGFGKVFFTNSGGESTEGAVKLARLWGNSRTKSKIFGFTGGFHGRTYASLSLMDKPLYKDGMEPFLPGTAVLPFNDVETLRSAVNEETAAIILEFIQGEGGIVSATQEFVSAIAELQQKFDFLIIADEVQAGCGRTGKFFGFENFDIVPDIVTMAKGIGGGLPLGAILGGERVENLWQKGMHGTTYGGNALACATGLVVMQEVKYSLQENAKAVGEYLRKKLEELKSEFPELVLEVRGLGLLAGMNLSKPSAQFVDAMLQRGIIINGTAETVIRLVPPLIISKNDVDECIAALRECFSGMK